MTSDHNSPHILAVENQRLKFALRVSGVGTWEIDPATSQVHWDDQSKQLFGYSGANTVSIEQLILLIDPEDRPRVKQELNRALSGQLQENSYTIRFRTVGTNGHSVQWVDCWGQSFVDEQQSAYRLWGTIRALDPAYWPATIADQQDLAKSEAQIRSLIESAPFPIGVYIGRQMIIQFANQSIIDVWGKGNDVIGKPYASILPELANQQIYAQLDQVYTTGIPFHANNQRVDLVIDGKLQPYYFKYSFTPLFDSHGNVYGVMNTAAEVTDLVLAKQQVEETQAALRGAIELAELATWQLAIPTGFFSYSERFMDWLGFSEATKSMDDAYNPLPDEYRQSVADAIAEVVKPGSSGIYQNEHPIINRLTGQIRIIHAQAQVFYDVTGQPILLRGTAQDITEQRQLQLALEHLVQQRTQELESTNEELAATNEEYAAMNEELEEANGQLMRSNDNLQQFSYVASHDLQEPLRKVQQFADLLKNQYGPQLNHGVDYLERMQAAASRMSMLIRDLLTFSRISTQQDVIKPISLNQIITTAINDLDLVIEETGADITVEPLPTIIGDPSQLGQLFQNLLNNALKFHRPGIAPQIRVSTQQVPISSLPATIRPTRTATTYYRIDVADNGIGFEQQYVDRIFQVFQRLHGKSEFAGTGIGLSICEKVAANHGGAITATSRPGHGATFSVYLPNLIKG